MNSRGISDSMADVLHEAAACAKCGSTARVGHDLCVNCLLQSGLTIVDDDNDSLDSALAEIDVKDADWRLGNYQILEEIGRGGMGVIYRARQRHSRRIVALKRILNYHADSRETLARFRREAEAAASLDHPNILPIYEVSEGEDGLPFFSMKFAPGGSLLDLGPALRDEPRRSVALMAKVARAVQYAHGQGILHRDLKPGNVMLDGRGEPLVSDFGLAKWLDTTSDLTRTLTVFGTPGYIAPEQAKGPAANLTPAADVYSLGAILFDLFTGQPPFLGEHALAVIQQAADKPAPKLRSLAPRLGRDLETICARCLEREPKARYHSAGDLAEDLERWLEGRPIIARPVSIPTRLYRWSKRSPKLAGSVAACLLLGTTAAVWQTQNRHLAATVREDELVAHSIGVLPILDLDTVTTESSVANEATARVLAACNTLESVRTVNLSETRPGSSHLAWKESELRRTALRAGARVVLMGTVRREAQNSRLVLTLVDAPTGRLLDREVVSDTNNLEQGLLSAVHQLHTRWTENFSRMDLPHLRADPLSAIKSEAARNYLLAGDDLLARRDPENLDRAVECYKKAVGSEPNASLAYASLAGAMGMRANFHMDPASLIEASAFAKKAVELDPRSPEAYRAKAVCDYELGRFPEAIEAGTRALEFDPTYPRAAGLLGAMANVVGRPDASLRWYYWAERAQNQPGDYSCNIAAALMALGEDEAAEKALHEGAEFRPELPYPISGMASLRMLQRRFDEARSLAEDVAARFPTNPDTCQVSAEVSLLSGKLADAERKYRKLLELNRRGGLTSSGISYLSATGWICLKTSREAEGRALLQEAAKNDNEILRIAPHHPRYLYSVAAAAAAFENRQQALSLLENAIAAGWIDNRFIRLDPRFDSLRKDQKFEQLLASLVTRTAELRRKRPADKLVTTK